MKRFGLLLLLIPTIALLVFAGKTLESMDFSIENTGTLQWDVALWKSLVITGDENERITVESSGRAVARATGAFITDNLDVIIPPQYANDVFDCFAYTDENDVVHLHRGDYSMEAPASYVSVSEVCAGLNLGYEYDVKNSKLIVLPNNMEEKALPARFDLREYDRTPKVKNQGNLGTCWAFSALSCVEAVNRPKEKMELSVDHLAYNNSFGLDINMGGAYTMGMSYLLSWQGPVTEEQDPYNDGKTDSTLSPVKHVQEIRFMDEKDYDEIKRSIYKYGPIETSIKNTLKGATSSSAEYNVDNHSYYYSGNSRPSHEVIIVGWDDDYPKENFNTTPKGNGAFICQNSWGTEFGEDGYFYVSYYDSIVGTSSLVYSSVEDPDNYDNIYQTDLCGWVGQVGTGNEYSCAMNVYTAKDDSNLEAMGFYATSKGMSYKLYVINDFTDCKNVDLKALEPVAVGSLDLMGFYTIPIDRVTLKKGERFAVAMELYSPENPHPIAVEHRATDITKNAVISDGEGYISVKGAYWGNVETDYECNICLKAYTKDIKG